jgi:uracil-DNA glycosylase family 4
MAPADARLTGPAPDCALCPRLVDFRRRNAQAFPHFHNAPVPAFAPPPGDAPWLLIVGLAPGLKGANATGRPFTGDAAGDLLYPALMRHGLAAGIFDRRADDGLALIDCRITNAVRCVPPENKPTAAEAKACRPFLADEIAALRETGLSHVLALGGLAHAAVLSALGVRKADHPFAHAALHRLPVGLTLADSYHCSRYNVNTGRLTEAMFDAVFAAVVRDAKP